MNQKNQKSLYPHFYDNKGTVDVVNSLLNIDIVGNDYVGRVRNVIALVVSPGI